MDLKALPLVVITLLLSACIGLGSNTAAGGQPGPDIWPTSPAADAPQDLGWIKRGDAATWPAYLPADIPPLEGSIRLVMEGGDRVRIFYEDMTKEQVDQYLQLLQQQGFHLQYQVYVQEGFPDNSAERMKKGDYDAVDITKGVVTVTKVHRKGRK